jgi:uridylate kinase
MQTKETVVISVGGSLISPPKGIDTGFLKKLKEFVETHTKAGYRFIIITGGGATARNYQNAGDKISSLEREDLDWLGIHATRLNGHLLRSVFRAYAAPALVKSFSTPLPHTPVIIAAGVAPGWSTDYVAVRLAKKAGAKRVINLSDIDFVYTRDPKRYKDARPIREIAWQEFMKLIPTDWHPGVHAPFDPVASREASKSKIEVAMVNGKKLSELAKYLSGSSFKGTRIV